MRILGIKAFEGINIFSFQPVIKVKLHLGTYYNKTTKDIEGFNNRLLRCLPSLKEHYCSKGYEGGFVERLHEGTMLGHVIEHVILELQALAGHDVIYGKTMSTDDEEVYEIVFEYYSKEGGFRAANLGVQLVTSVLNKETVDPKEMVSEIIKVTLKNQLGPSTAAIARAAWRKDIPVMRLGEGSILQLGYGKYQKRVEATITGNTSCLGVDIACDKALTKELLGEMGIPVPIGSVVRTLEEAEDTAEEIGYPVVVKPYDGNQGKGVNLNLLNKEQLKEAYNLAREFSDKLIVEKYIRGKHYRLLVVGGRVIAAAERIPAAVVGDGIHTIGQLIEIINQDPLRGEDHDKPLTKITVDSVVKLTLSRQGLDLGVVLPDGNKVMIRENANLSTGGVAIDVTERVHPINASLVLRAVQIIGLDVAGVDIVTEDISKPMDPSKGALIEVNAAPGLRMHQFPGAGKSRDAGKAIVDLLFPPHVKARIPIIAITGTNGKTTTTRMVGHILQSQGNKVGMATTDGIFIDGQRVVRGDCTGPNSAKAILRDPSVEWAILETARGGILRAGLGFDRCDVAIITNITGDHLGQDGIKTIEELALVKALVGEVVGPGGTVVLNADDPVVLSLKKRFKNDLYFFSMSSDNPIIRQHLGVGGKAVFIKNGAMVYAQGGVSQKVVVMKSIPATLGGIARHNMENTLAAAAGLFALGVEIEQVREGLLSFKSNMILNPGRINFREVAGIKIMIDYAHNKAGYQAIIQMIRKLNSRKLIGVIGVPGDRLDEAINQVGEIAGKGFNYLIIKEDQDGRGRPPGQVAELLMKGVRQAGVRDENICIVLDESKAVERALAIAQPGDMVVVFYENLDRVNKIINQYDQNPLGKAVDFERKIAENIG